VTPRSPGVLVVGSVDAELARHLVIALGRHRRWCREQRVPMPAALDELVEVLGASVRASAQERAVVPAANGGQIRPDPANVVAGVDRCGGGPDPAPVTPLTVDYATAGARLGRSARTVRRMVADGQLVPVVVGGRRRIRVADLEAFGGSA
jgi:excisionase family DNA binding protein